MKKKIHLVANAHLDPVWLWPWEEGAAEALSTFRTAAILCQEYPDFIFNHNEALLYEWIKEYEPSLFRLIQKLVKKKKWHVMGGWFLQPDVNMPSGESLVRQALWGRRFFRHHFGAEPKTAVNFDSFGHSRGLVQILARSGYDSYIFCRPGPVDKSLPSEEFIWVGYDGSEVLAARATAHYNSRLGHAREKVEEWLKNHPDQELNLILWGVGNHGGGASRQDLQALQGFAKEHQEFSIMHSTPEAFFKDLGRMKKKLPRLLTSLNPWAVGCYTSMNQVKKLYRELESEYFLVEKMATAAFFQGFLPYPEEDLRQALRDLLFAQFHDILPGSASATAEKDAWRLINHGLELLARVKANVFFHLAAAEAKPKDAEIPLLVFNPHPFPVSTTFEVEFQPHEMNWETGFLLPRVELNGQPVDSQVEKEETNLNVEWRKKVVFSATLQPSALHRFSCFLEKRPSRPEKKLIAEKGFFSFISPDLEVTINCSTGLIDRLRLKGEDVLESGAFQPLVMLDNSDPWGMTVRSFRDIAGYFRLIDPDPAGLALQGLVSPLPSVRLVEDGPVRTIIESALTYNRSLLFLRYKLPKKGTEVEVEVRVYWQEKDRLLKLSLPTSLHESWYLGQSVYGIEELPVDGSEVVSQRWVALVSKNKDMAITCINDGVYGSDCLAGEIRLSLLRAPAYAADPVPDRPMLSQDRYIPRHDQGERIFRFWINAGGIEKRLNSIEREALIHHEKPVFLPYCPPGKGEKRKPFLILHDSVTIVPALKKSETGNDLIIRLFEPTGKTKETTLELPAWGVRKKVRLRPFEVRTLRFNPKKKSFTVCNLLEEPETKKYITVCSKDR
ncbi:MAG: glycoside hydrolase family 38 C-terminal domain-containing protein [Candidatus Aminicenantales bacterium]